MNPEISNLIATAVTPKNAHFLEELCQAELCFAHSRGDVHDLLALRGKLQQARDLRTRPVAFGEPGHGLDQIAPVFGRGWRA